MQKSRSKHPSPAGQFTLIELALVVVIISIAAALIGPRLIDGMSGRGIDSAVKRLAVLGEHAGNLAATTRQPHTFVIDLQEGNYYVTKPAIEEAQEDEDRPGFEKTYSLPEDVSFTKAKLEDADVADTLEIRFFPDGWADNAVIQLKDRSSRTVSVKFTRSMGKVVIINE